MKITSLLFTVLILIILILFPPLSFSQTRLTTAPVKRAETARLMPDLIVSNIKLIKDCKIEITIKNIGTSGVPASGYDLKKGAGIQMYNGAKAWGGIRLGAIDRSGRLKTPGNSVKYVWFPKAANLALGAGTHSIKVVVDNNNAVAELNENNNSKTSRLMCKQPVSKKEKKKIQKDVSKRTDGVSQHKTKLESRQPSKPGRVARPMPDLIVSTIRLIKDCKIEITIKNIGTSGVPVSGYHLKKGAAIQMYNGGKAWGGIRLGAIDRSGRLKTQGNSVKYVWFPKAANLALGAGTHSIKVVVDNNNAVAELNENNNSKTSRLMCEQPVSKKEKREMQNAVSKRTDGVPQHQTKIDLPRFSSGVLKPLRDTSPPNQNQPQHDGGSNIPSNLPPVAGGLEGSNTSSSRLPVGGGLDVPIITVVNKTVVPQNPKLDQEVTASFTVKNIGSVATSGPLPFTAKIYSSDENGIQTLGGSSFYRWHFDSFEPGDEHTISLSGPMFHLGLHAASLVISRTGSSVPGGYSGDIVIPSDPTYQFFQVLQPYDLGFYGSYGCFERTAGGIRIRIKNYGSDIPQEQHNRLGVFLQVENGDMQTKPMTIVDPNGILKNSGQGISFVWPLSQSNWHNKLECRIYIGILDVDGEGTTWGVGDTNPSNNNCTKDFGGYNDLVVCFKKYVYHTKPLRFRYYDVKVKNIGNLPSDYSNLKFYIEKKGTKTYSIPALNPGEEHSITRKVYWGKKGIRKFKLEVNSSGSLEERALREHWLNNIFKGKIYIKKDPPGPGTVQCSDHPDAANLW